MSRGRDGIDQDVVWCDGPGCSAWRFRYQDGSDSELRKAGWVVAETFHVCPRCVARGRMVQDELCALPPEQVLHLTPWEMVQLREMVQGAQLGTPGRQHTRVLEGCEVTEEQCLGELMLEGMFELFGEEVAQRCLLKRTRLKVLFGQKDRKLDEARIARFAPWDPEPSPSDRGG